MINNKKIAVIGTGRMGKIHIRVLSRLGVLCAISDVNEAEAKKISQEFNNVPYFKDYNEMIKKIKPNGVIIATPTFLHFTIAKDILNNYELEGLLIEKPVSSTLAEGMELQEYIEKSGKKTKVTVGHIEVFNPVVTRMLQIFENGAIGELRTLIFQRRGAVSDGRLESIGDVFGDIGIHDFDIASRLLKGSFKLTAHSLKHSNIINSSTITLYNEKSICSFHLSREYAGKKRQIEIEGTSGTMIVDLLDQYVTIRQLGIAKGDTKSITIPYGSGEIIKVYGEPLLEEIWQFIDTMDGAEPLVSIKDGLKGLKMIEAARESSEKGVSIDIEF